MLLREVPNTSTMRTGTQLVELVAQQHLMGIEPPPIRCGYDSRPISETPSANRKSSTSIAAAAPIAMVA
jgi:hypothetical protein